VHAALLLLLPLLLNDDPRLTRAEALRVWLTEKPSAMNKEVPTNEKKTVVEIKPVAKTERPKEARFLAELDQSATNERRARAGQKGQNVADDNNETKPTRRAERESSTNGQKREHVRKNDPLGLRPQFKEKTSAHSGGEFLPEIKEGEHTELNAWQWRHAPFFNRIKARIGQIWSPQTQIARFDPQGVLLGQQDRVTVLQVTIDRKGDLRDLKITAQSGVAYLDDEAERTLRVAAPFPFPPQELFIDNDEFSFTFAFHLYLNRGFSFGFDWNKD
jgi:TonB family protein